MEVLGGLYRIQKPHIVEEKHGGGILKDNVYWFVAFMGDEVGLYGSGPKDFRRYVTKNFELKGRIERRVGNDISFSIRNPHSNNKLVFEGEILKEGEEILLRASNENSPETYWINDIFIKIELPEETFRSG